jgi:hypothetical protein
VQEFKTAVRAAEAEDDRPSLEFDLDGVMITAFHPGDGQLAYLLAATSSHQSNPEKVAGLINFLVAVMDDDSHAHVAGRLLDRDDPFGLEEVSNIFEWMVGEWAGRPTKQPSDFQSSRRSAGARSKQPTRARK